MKFLNLKTAVVVLITVSLFACKKDTSPNPTLTNVLDGLVKMQIDSINTIGLKTIDTMNYTYDSIGRAFKIVSPSGKVISSFLYPSNSQLSVTNNNGNFVTNNVCFLNSSQNIDSTYSVNYNISTKYSYSNQKLVQIIEYRNRLVNSTINYIYDSLNNVAKIIESIGNVIDITYFTTSNTVRIGTKINRLSAFNPSKFGELVYLQSRLIKTTTETVGSNVITNNYAYTFNLQNRVATMTILQNGAFYSKSFYTYY